MKEAGLTKLESVSDVTKCLEYAFPFDVKTDCKMVTTLKSIENRLDTLFPPVVQGNIS